MVKSLGVIDLFFFLIYLFTYLSKSESAGQMNCGVYGRRKRDGQRQAGIGWGHGNHLNWICLWRCCHMNCPLQHICMRMVILLLHTLWDNPADFVVVCWS